jgi:RNA polymerase sigma-70 factor, ECF subfamily
MARNKAAHIPYRVPADHELPDRLRPVLTTIYSVFTAGHHATHGELAARVDLADEAIRVGRLLVTLMPDENKTVGLLAMTLATHARRAARTSLGGDLILLADQDRSLWDHAMTQEASELVESVLRRGRPAAYQVQAAIACLHGPAPSFAETSSAVRPRSGICTGRPAPTSIDVWARLTTLGTRTREPWRVHATTPIAASSRVALRRFSVRRR